MEWVNIFESIVSGKFLLNVTHQIDDPGPRVKPQGERKRRTSH